MRVRLWSFREGRAVAPPKIMTRYLASYIIEVNMVGMYDGKMADLSNPKARPMYVLDFTKNRHGGNHRIHIYDGTIKYLPQSTITKEEVRASLEAVEEFHRNGTNEVYMDSEFNIVRGGC